MKRLIPTLLLMLFSTIVAMACLKENPPYVTVDGIHYAYDGREIWICGFEAEQDSVVLPQQVMFKGKITDIKTICIVKSPSPRVLVVPDGYLTITELNLPRLEKLYISKSVELLHDRCTSEHAHIKCEKLKAIIVDNNNKHFRSIDGILYSKDKLHLLKYPPMKEGKAFTIPSHVKGINIGAFTDCHLEKIYYPKSKDVLSYAQFETEDMEYLQDITGIGDKVKLLPK